MEVLASRLKWLRENNRFSQKEIAEKIGMSLNGYQKQENGSRDPKLDVLIKFAEIYNETVDFLLGITDVPNTLKKEKESLDHAWSILKTHKEFLNKHSNEEELYNQIFVKSKDLLENYKILLFNYMQKFIEVPFANPMKDSNLKNVFPVEFKFNQVEEVIIITMYSAEGVEISKVGEVFYLGNYDEQVENAEKLMEWLYKKYNKNVEWYYCHSTLFYIR